MRLLSSFHNPVTKKYAIYYSLVLTIVSTTIFFTTLQIIHQNPLSNAMTFFEGFFSLFMLSRSKIVGGALLAHISKIKLGLKQSVILP
jgi:hypothetical protein